MQGQQFVIGQRGSDIFQRFPLANAAPFIGTLGAGAVHKNAAHRGSRRGKEMAAVAVGPLSFAPHQPHIRFVHQCRRLQRLPRLLLGPLYAAASFRNSSYTSGSSCSAADGSPDSICDRMRLTLDMGSLEARGLGPIMLGRMVADILPLLSHANIPHNHGLVFAERY